ncbi:MAG: anti-sigma factor antagonist [Usitatibacter sp.]
MTTMVSRTFGRSFEALEDIAAFTRATFGEHQLDARLLPVVDLALEELFTNMVKYSRTTDPEVRIDMTRVAGGVEVTITDRGVDFFDVTRAGEVDVSLPIGERTAGGLGLHLIRKMVDFIEYQYLEDSRSSRITFRATAVERRRKPRDKKMLAIDYGADGKVVIAGRLDAAQCTAAQAFLDRVEGSVTLDCTRLEYISSAGLGVLLKTQKRLMASAGKLRLAGVSRHLQDIFQYSGFDQIFEIEPAE